MQEYSVLYRNIQNITVIIITEEFWFKMFKTCLKWQLLRASIAGKVKAMAPRRGLKGTWQLLRASIAGKVKAMAPRRGRKGT